MRVLATLLEVDGGKVLVGRASFGELISDGYACLLLEMAVTFSVWFFG